MARDQEAYQERYNDLLARYTAATERITELTEIKEKRKSQQTVLTAFTDTMENQKQMLDSFDEKLWLVVIEKATIFSDGKIVFTFINGTEIEA